METASPRAPPQTDSTIFIFKNIKFSTDSAVPDFFVDDSDAPLEEEGMRRVQHVLFPASPEGHIQAVH